MILQNRSKWVQVLIQKGKKCEEPKAKSGICLLERFELLIWKITKSKQNGRLKF